MLALFSHASKTALWLPLSRRVMLEVTRLFTRSRSMVRRPPFSGTCTTCTAWPISTIAMKEACAAGGRFTLPMGIILIWANGGYLGCRLATSTVSSTKWPISWRALRLVRRPAQPSARPWKHKRYVTRCSRADERRNGSPSVSTEEGSKMKTLPQLHIRSIQARPVLVPMTRPLYTSTGAVTQAPLLLIDLQAEEGVIGRSYLFGYQPFTLKPLHELVAAFGGMIAGDRVAPFDLDRKLRSNSKLMG